MTYNFNTISLLINLVFDYEKIILAILGVILTLYSALVGLGWSVRKTKVYITDNDTYGGGYKKYNGHFLPEGTMPKFK